MFEKKCPVCGKDFVSLESYMNHIKNNHRKEKPEKFVKNKDEIRWSFRSE